MSVPTNESPPDPPRSEWPAALLRHADITPETAAAQPAYIEGVATLVWPYSQSNGTFAVVVCEEDFRLRNNRGQLKVNFRGATARRMKDVLRATDKVKLSLEGAELEELADATQRDVPWALKYSHRLHAKIRTDSGEVEIDMEDHAPSPVPLEFTIPSVAGDAPEEESDLVPGIRTPTRKASDAGRRTPETHKRGADEITSSPLIPRGFFGDEDMDGDIYEPRKRPRFSSSFRLVERSPSPEIPADASNAIAALNRAITESRHNSIVSGESFVPDMAASVQPPATVREPAMEFTPAEAAAVMNMPSMDTAMNGQPGFGYMFPPGMSELSDRFSGSNAPTEMPDSPSLRPVPSPSLPLVSPFIHKDLGGDYMQMDMDNQVFAEVPQDMPVDASLAVTVDEQIRMEGRIEELPSEDAQAEAREEQAGEKASDAQAADQQAEERPADEQPEEAEAAAAPPAEPRAAELAEPDADATDVPAPAAEASVAQPASLSPKSADAQATQQTQPETVPTEEASKPENASKPEDTPAETASSPKEPTSPKSSAPASFTSADNSESERDSLFDEASDRELPRFRSKSPAPRPSRLRHMIPAKSPDGNPSTSTPSRLSIRTGFTPVNEGGKRKLDALLKTPHLYLPTPSPKVVGDQPGFPFTAPPKRAASMGEVMVDKEGEEERRRLFREKRRSMGGLEAFLARGRGREGADEEAVSSDEEHIELPSSPMRNKAMVRKEEKKEEKPEDVKDQEEDSNEQEEIARGSDGEPVDPAGYASDDEKAEGERPSDDDGDDLDGEEQERDPAEDDRPQEDEDQDQEMADQVHELEEELEEQLDSNRASVDRMEVDVEEVQQTTINGDGSDKDEEMADAVEQAATEALKQAEEDLTNDEAAEEEIRTAIDEAEEQLDDQAEDDEVEDEEVDQIPTSPVSDEPSPRMRRPLAVDEFEDDYDEDEYDDDEGIEGELESGDEEGSYDSEGYAHTDGSDGDNPRDGDWVQDSDDEEEEEEAAGRKSPIGFVPGQVIDLISDDEDEAPPPKARTPPETEEPASAAVSDADEDEDPPRAPSPPPTDFKSGLTTPLSDFPALAFLSYATTVDLIGIVAQHTPPARAAAGQKDHYLALRIVDSSLPTGIVVRLFRPYKQALPRVAVGDAIILRAVRINSLKRKLMAVSTENSAWAVWGDARDGECNGPPMEYGDEERGYVKGIRRWWGALAEETREEMMRRPEEELTAGVK